MKFLLYALLFAIFYPASKSPANERTQALKPKPTLLLSISEKLVDSQDDNSKFKEPAGAISLTDAVAAALQGNPSLAVFAQEIRAREAEALQAGLRPNPGFAAEAENMAGSGSFAGLDEAEITLSVGQLFELGGKRQKRAQAAILNADLAAWDFEIARLAVYKQVVAAFTELLAAQQRIELQQDLKTVAEEALQDIERRINAGRESPAEAARAKVELSKTTITLEKMQQHLLALKRTLAATWGSTRPQFEQVTGTLEQTTDLPSLETLQKFVSQHPLVAARAAAMQLRDAELELAKAQRLPDPTVEGGVRRLNGSGDNAFVVNVSLPLLLFDRNQGAIQAAELRRQQADKQKQAAALELQTELARIYAALSASTLEIESLRSTVIDEAQRAYELINDGFKMGKYGFLDVLDAQRTLFEVKSQYLNALSKYHLTLAQLESLIGRKAGQLQ